MLERLGVQNEWRDKSKVAFGKLQKMLDPSYKFEFADPSAAGTETHESLAFRYRQDALFYEHMAAKYLCDMAIHEAKAEVYRKQAAKWGEEKV